MSRNPQGTLPGVARSDAEWHEIGAATTRHLQALVSRETVNPPGNEMRVASYLDQVLRDAGIETWLAEPSPGRAALVARIRGSGAARPVLLLAHMDVVGVEPEKWRHPPFGAEIHDGYLYGRGAIDDKGMLAANLQAMLLVRQLVAGGARPARDVVLVATSDEETGGIFGIDWLLSNHRELLDAEFALNEGGRVRVVEGRTRYCAVQCAEKVPHNVLVTAYGPGGHAAVPHDANAITRLTRALARVVAHREALTVSDVTRRFFEGLAAFWPDAAVGEAMRDVALGDPTRMQQGALVLSRTPSLDALLRTGISPTLISGGIRANVIPTEATATLNIRTLPEDDIGDVVARLRAAIDDAHVTLTVKGSGAPAPASPIDSPMFAAIADTAAALEPGIVTVPYLSTGATDSAALRAAGIHCYGLLPFPLTQDDEDRMHGHDERIPLDALLFGVKLVTGTIVRVSGIG